MSAGQRGRPRDPEADSAILRAALELFCERGADGTSIEQIARRAGVGKLTVYRRWSSKEQVLARAIESARAQVDVPPLGDVSDVPVPELVERAVEVLAAALSAPRNRDLISRVIGARTSHPSLVRTFWEHCVEPRRRVVRALLERAEDEGHLAESTDLDVLVDVVVGAIIHRAVVQPDPPDEDAMREYLRTLLRQAGLLT